MSCLTAPFREIEKTDGVYDVVIDTGLIDIDKSQIIKSLGYSEDGIDEYFDQRITELISRLPGKCVIRAGYRIMKVDAPDPDGEGLHINDVFFRVHDIITAHLKRSEKIAAFVCTIGSGMEALSKQLFTDGDPLGGHFVDVIASEAAEKCAELLHCHIEAVMAVAGLQVTNRYSPGYCGWEVAEQRKLFSLFPEKFCGVTINESSLMAPVKSVSGIVGIGSNVRNKPYPCERCKQEACIYKRYKDTQSRELRENSKKG